MKKVGTIAFNQIKEEETEKDKENKEDEKYFNDEKGEKEVIKMKIVYNDKKLDFLKIRKYLIWESNLKKIKENYRKDNKKSKKYKTKDFILMRVELNRY